jgi:hypothetical protein
MKRKLIAESVEGRRRGREEIPQPWLRTPSLLTPRVEIVPFSMIPVICVGWQRPHPARVHQGWRYFAVHRNPAGAGRALPARAVAALPAVRTRGDLRTNTQLHKCWTKRANHKDLKDRKCDGREEVVACMPLRSLRSLWFLNKRANRELQLPADGGSSCQSFLNEQNSLGAIRVDVRRSNNQHAARAHPEVVECAARRAVKRHSKRVPAWSEKVQPHCQIA